MKTHFFYILYWCALSTCLLSCSFFFDTSIKVEEREDTASFIVQEVQGQVVATRVNGLPEEIQMSYTACFKDFVYQDNRLPGGSHFKIHFFEHLQKETSQVNKLKKIKSKNTSSFFEETCSKSKTFLFSNSISCIELETDSNGCLSWTEVYPYRPQRDSVWYRYGRAFEGRGVNKGIKTVSLAVNPWLSLDASGSASQLVDLRHRSIAKKGQLIDIKDNDLPQCRFCASSQNKKDCDICRHKKNSLSGVMAHFEQHSSPPRLWTDKATTHISQEHIVINKKLSQEHLKMLKQFKVCSPHNTEGCDLPGRFFKVRLHIPLKIQVQNYRGEEEYPLLNRGDYTLKAYLFLKSETGEHIQLHRDMGFMSARLFKGGGANLRADFYFHVPYEHYGLPAYLGLKIQQNTKPSAKPVFLPFEGVFPFDNNLRTVVGKQDIYIEKSVLSFYKTKGQENLSLLDSYQLSGSWEKGKDLGFRKAGWEIQLKRLRFSDVDLDTCPTLVGRTVRYVGEVCIVDPLTGEAVSDTSISIQRQNIELKADGSFEEKEVQNISKVYKPSAEGISLLSFQEGRQIDLQGKAINQPTSTADTSGCLRWVDKLSHKWYNKEKYFIRRMIFSKKEWGFAGEKMIAINPWHWGFVFFQDISQLGHSAIRTNPQKAEPPRVVLHDFRSLFPDLIYTIDRWLGINLFQNLLFLFRIRIDRPDNVSVGLGGQRPSAQEARRGYYNVRFTLVKSHTEEAGGKGNQVVNYHTYHKQPIKDGNHNQGWALGRRGGEFAGQMMNTNLEYITHYDTHVQVRDSMANAYANFLFDLNEFVFIGSNSRLIVQLWPTDPKYYAYKEGSCEIDPQKSQFKAFTDHDLITPAFMGTFVPGDQRNWNIFRALSESVSLDRSSNLDVVSLNMNEEQTSAFAKEGTLSIPSQIAQNQNNTISLNNISHSQWDRFIKNSKKRSDEHKLWTKIGTTFTVQTNSLSETARPLVRQIGPQFENLHTAMEAFLKAEPDDSPLSLFQQKKNQLLEIIDLIMPQLSTVLEGATLSKEERTATYTFFQDMQNLLHNKLSPVLKNLSIKPLAQHDQVEKLRRSFINLVNKALDMPLPSEKIQAILNKTASQKWFKEGITFPNDPAKWSGFNMNLFAKDRGLKIITMQDSLMDQFVEDLNISARVHNTYHKKMATEEEAQNTSLQEDSLDGEGMLSDFNPATSQEGQPFTQTEGSQGELNFEEHGAQIEQSQKERKLFWDNFELMDGDDYHTMKEKTAKMYLPAINKDWVGRVLESGVHTGNLQTPEVMTFLHSLCGFWFNSFYNKYLEQQQLDTIFENHMDHFRYYKGTLDYLSDDAGSYQQYEDLHQAMRQYNLIEMDQSFLKKQNPFILWTRKESFFYSIFVRQNERDFLNQAGRRPTGTGPVLTDALYESLDKVWIDLVLNTGSIDTSNYTSVSAHSLFLRTDLLGEHRHPYFKCIANPLNFFHTEKKVVVGDIGSDYSDLKYEYGLTYSYNLQRAFDYAYSTQWSMSRSFSASLGTGFTAFGNLDKIINPLMVVNPFIEFNGVKLGADFGTSRSDADANRRQHSLRFSDESMYFQVNKSVISVRLKHFRHCLVVRAKNQAFEGYDSESIKVWKEELEKNFVHQIPYIKSGLMLCSEDIDADKDLEAPFYIKEDYYYLYQLMPMDRGQFQNPLSFRNRPYIMSVRGRTEMEKLGFLLHSFVEGDKKEGVEDYNPFWLMTNPYNTAPRVAEGTREMIQQAKVWDKTGFYPGVYDVNYDHENYFLREPTRTNNVAPKEAQKKKPYWERIGAWLHKNNLLEYIRFDETPPTPYRSEP